MKIWRICHKFFEKENPKEFEEKLYLEICDNSRIEK